MNHLFNCFPSFSYVNSVAEEFQLEVATNLENDNCRWLESLIKSIVREETTMKQKSHTRASCVTVSLV